MAICKKQHRYLEGFNELPEAQDNNSPQSDLSHLPDSQAGTVRHKSAIDAYNLGYKYGKKISS